MPLDLVTLAQAGVDALPAGWTLAQLIELRWPAATVALAFSPLGKAFAAVLQRWSGSGPQGTGPQVADAMGAIAKALERQADALHRMELILTRLEERIPAGGD